MTRAEEAKLLHRAERNAFIDRLRHDATRQGTFDRAMWHLDHPVPGTDFYLVPSDGGASAARMYADVESGPLWRKLWSRAQAELPRTGKAVLRALLADWRTAVAARAAGVSRPTVDFWKKEFRIFFAQCFRARKRDFG